MINLNLDKSYVLFGAGYCNVYLLVLSWLLILHFLYSLYKINKKIGWKIDYWHVTIGMYYVLPYFFIYPFAAHPLNLLTIGNWYYKAVPYVDTVFLLHVFGYLMLLLGSYSYKVLTKNNLQPIRFNGFEKFEEFYAYTIRNSYVNKLILVLSLFFFIVLVGLVITGGGDVFNGRKFFMEHRSLNPLFLLGLKVISLGALYATLRAVDIPSKRRIFIVLLFVVFTLISGTRGAILGVFLNAFFYWSYKNYTKLKYRYILFGGILFLVTAVLISIIRSGGNISRVLAKMSELLYGNTFSDLRDASWFFASWDGNLVLGKNYLADLMVFIPSSFSDFRQDWSYGFYTVNVALGGPSHEHAGLRIGFFGEIFVNFGWVGVIILGLIIGFTIRWVDHRIKYDVIVNDDIISASTRLLFLSIIVGLSNTSSLFLNFYVLLFSILTLGGLIKLMVFLFPKHRD